MSESPTGPLHAALQSLGLTGLEAEVYVSLLALGRATGYRVGKEIGRPTANVYKALDALAAKGAVLAQEGGEGLFAAVTPRRFLAQLRDAFDRHEGAVLAGVRRLEVKAEPAGVFALHTWEQAVERFETMVEGARRVVLVDSSPAPLERWSPLLARVAAAGVRILVKAYGPVEIERAEVAVDPNGEDIRRRWGVDWLHAVADGSELMLSAHQRGRLLRGLWTQEPFVSVCYHEALAGEIVLATLGARMKGDASRAELVRVLDRTLESVRLDAVGFERLQHQLRAEQPDISRTGGKGG
jgi:sugar-specific transcriptional regulator TrmB